MNYEFYMNFYDVLVETAYGRHDGCISKKMIKMNWTQEDALVSVECAWDHGEIHLENTRFEGQLLHGDSPLITLIHREFARSHEDSVKRQMKPVRERAA